MSLIDVWNNAEKIGNLANVIVAVVALAAFFITLREYFGRKKQYKEENKPYIIVELVRIGSSLLDINIENIGKSAAKNIRITFDPNVEISSTGLKINDLKIMNNMKFLPPSRKISFFFGSYLQQGSRSIKKEFQVTATYTDLEGDKYESEFTIDPRDFEGTSTIDRKDIHNVAKSLESINKTLNGLHDSSKRLTKTFVEEGIRFRNNHTGQLKAKELLTLIINIYQNGCKYEMDLRPFIYDMQVMIKEARDLILTQNTQTVAEKDVLDELNWLLENDLSSVDSGTHLDKLASLVPRL